MVKNQTKTAILQKIKTGKKELVFHVGAEAGFYSEYINMLSAILYCWKHDLRFVLYSQDANFSFKKGWTDYFVPFAIESKDPFHSYFNTRARAPRLNSFWKILLFGFHRKFFPKQLLTYEIWSEIYSPEFDKQLFTLKDSMEEMDLKAASRMINDQIYIFNKTTNNEINSLIEELKLPENYLSIQVRKGDKKMEWEQPTLQQFMNYVGESFSCKNIFIFTDDYSVVEEAKMDYPEYQFYTFAQRHEKGYFHDDFIKLNANSKRSAILRLFSNIEVCRNSLHFIGTYTTNTGLFLGIYMPEGKMTSIQKKSWFQFSTDDVEHKKKY